MSLPKSFSERAVDLFKDHWLKKSADTPYNRKNEFDPPALYVEMRNAWHSAGVVLERIREANRYREAPLLDLFGRVESAYAVYVTEAELEALVAGSVPDAFWERLARLRTNLQAERDEDGRVSEGATLRLAHVHPLTEKGRQSLGEGT